jgi:UDP-glucose 4-epimerase
MATVLVTGGAGYIGSHTVSTLLQQEYSIIVADDLRNSSMEVVRRIKEISGRDFSFYQIDVCDSDAFRRIFEQRTIDAVIHLAGLKALGESVQKPLSYYRNNIDSALTLLELMAEYQVKRLVFSSSATVYDSNNKLPLSEDAQLKASNPYSWSKLMIERILASCVEADQDMAVILLRYFNPIGADKSGRLGEDPRDIPNNLMPYITQVAIGDRDYLQVFGNDYPTRDGTGVRDYIHVLDLVEAHRLALDYLFNMQGILALNLGTGKGYSVLEVIKTFEEVSGCEIKYKITGRRPGDMAEFYADPSLAYKLLGWKAKRDLAEMCLDSWRWQKLNPSGYERS